MKKLLTLVLTISLLSGCGSFTTTKPAIVYQTQEVKVAVPVFVDAPVVDKFESRVLQLNDNSPAGEVGQSYKVDWLTLMYRDHLFTDFLKKYKEAKDSATDVTK